MIQQDWSPLACAQQHSEGLRPHSCTQQDSRHQACEQQQRPLEEWRPAQPYSAQHCPLARQRQRGGISKVSQVTAEMAELVRAVGQNPPLQEQRYTRLCWLMPEC